MVLSSSCHCLVNIDVNSKLDALPCCTTWQATEIPDVPVSPIGHITKLPGHVDGVSVDGAESTISYNSVEAADQSVDELMPVNKMTEELAGKLIMTARAPMFEGKK